MGVEGTVREARDGAVEHVAERQNLRALGLRGLQRRDRVSGLPRLADGDDEVIREEDRISIPDLARELDDSGHTCELLYPVAPGDPGVMARAARHQVHAAQLLCEF